jgi:Fe-S oxidoreductase
METGVSTRMDQATSARLEELFKGKLHQAMRLYLETCTRCGNCIDACHVYQSMPELRYTAVGRAEVVRKIFKRYFTLEGKIAPWLGEVIDLDEPGLERVFDAAWSCTGCRRCMICCPFGIDTQMIMSIAKALLIGADREPKILTMLADMSLAKAETLETSKAGFEEAIRNLEPEVEALWPTPAGARTIPLGVEGADVLYVGLAGKHTIVAAAAILNAAGENWTLSYFEAVNFGAFAGDAVKAQAIARRIVGEATRLKVKEVAVVECGTAFRFLRQMIGPQPFRVVSLVELIARYLKQTRILLRTGTVPGTLTYHDPCQIARNAGVMDDPRTVIGNLTGRFVELSPSREDNWCCGGGGGLIAAGDKEFRMKSSRVKAEQMKASGATVICTACENCHTQLTELNEHYALGMEVESLANLAARALLRPGALR